MGIIDDARAIIDKQNSRGIDPTVTNIMVQQIGAMNMLAISGARFTRVNDLTIVLPVRYGYRVRVTYQPGSDTYKVERLYNRGGKTWVKGTMNRVYCENLGEAAYHASCYLDSFGD